MHEDKDDDKDHLHCHILYPHRQDVPYQQYAHESDFYDQSLSETLPKNNQSNEWAYESELQHIYLHYQ